MSDVPEDVLLPFVSDESCMESSEESDMDSQSTSSSCSLSDYTDLRTLWEFFEHDVDCGYITLYGWYWGCAWLHVYLNPEDRRNLEDLFALYAVNGRLAYSEFSRFLSAWADDRFLTLLSRCSMECSWHS